MFKPITEIQVLQIIAKLVNSKATGLAGIPNRALKCCAEVITPSLTFIFNFSVITKIFPDDLKVAKVAPVFKKGERDDLGNYRPISVLPTVARVLEKLIFDQLFQYFSENELLGNEQYGFRSLYSTALALGKVTNSWLLNIDNGKINSAVFLDIRKAFHTVDHKILLDKLKCYGMPENEITFFSSYLDNRQQCCHVNGMTSSTRKITCGVPQGSIIGPSLFIVYMNDVPLFVKDAEITMYAYDTSLLKAFTTINQLQEEVIPAFAKVCEWLKNNKLSLNTVKTEFMILGTSQKLHKLDSGPHETPFKLLIHEHEIRRVRLVKYLGLMVDDCLTWEAHVKYITGKTNRGIGILKRVRHIVRKDSLMLLYFRYCNVVWG